MILIYNPEDGGNKFIRNVCNLYQITQCHIPRYQFFQNLLLPCPWFWFIILKMEAISLSETSVTFIRIHNVIFRDINFFQNLLLPCSWFWFIILKMEAISLSETFVIFIRSHNVIFRKIIFFFQNLLPPCPNARNVLYYRKVYVYDFVMILSCILVTKNETKFNFVCFSL
jgi:uncharacterized membrane protein YobD (UPF0266 family)